VDLETLGSLSPLNAARAAHCWRTKWVQRAMRVEHSKVFDKGRRPRRHLKSQQAHKGVRRLRTMLLIIAMIAASVGMALF
jgi:hypothetical protein